LKSIFRRPAHQLRPGHKIELAFTANGIDYYHFPDVLSMGFERALTALSFYEELRMRTTREYLEAHCRAMREILADPKKIDVYRISILNKNLQDRLGLIVEPEIVYKLAAVMYFDQTEDPYRYDFAYGQKKIERWKKDLSLKSFFLSTPIKNLIPGLDSFEENLENYSEVVKVLNDKMWETISSQLSDSLPLLESVRKSPSLNGSRRRSN
jgi:hypothetical protein